MHKTQSIDLLINASWVVPVMPQNRVLRDCGVAINDGKIVGLFPSVNAQEHVNAKQIIDLPNHVLLPGLINAHGHTPMSLLRGYADDKPLMDWLQKHIWPAEQKWVDEDFVRHGSTLAVAEMLLSGTTCFADMYFYPEATASVALDTGIRAQINFPILDFPSAWANDADDYLRKGLALHDNYRSHELITIGFGPHAPYTVSDEPLKKIAMYAEELQSTIQIHLHETAFEVQESLDKFGKRPTERLAELGLLTPLTQCVHMTQVNDADIAIVRESGAHVVHCPKSNLKLASGSCPTQKLLDNHINVCVGTDGAASNNSLNLFDEIQTAALIGKITSGNAAAIDARTALEMATINAAKAMGQENKIGSLEPGKFADIIAVDLSGFAQQPLYDVVSQLIYTQVGNRVSHVWVNGKQLVENYELQTLSLPDIVNQTKKWQNKISVN